MKLLVKLERNKQSWFLVGISFFFFLLRLPSLFEPYWYGDEGIYEVIGFALRHGRLLYQGIWDNKPPLLYLLYAIFNGDQPTVRFVSLLAGLTSVILFFFLAKKLFRQEKISMTTTTLFALLLGTPLIEGNIANAENFMIPLILASALLILNTADKQTKKHSLSYLILNTKYFILFTSGLLLGLAFLFKVVSVFDLGAFTFFLLFTRYKDLKHLFSQIITIIPLYVGFFLPLIVTIIFFVFHHALGEFIHSAFLSNISYVNYGNTFLHIPQGLLIIKLIVLGTCCLFLFFKRKNLSSAALLVLLWLAFSIFSALFSQRPYTHYLLVLVTSFSLFFGLIWKSKKYRIPVMVCFLIVGIFILKNFNLNNKTIAYYQNFTSFIAGQKTETQYQAFFDWNTPRDYALGQFLQTHMRLDDQIFLWGNNGQLYRLVNKLPPGRYIVAYHMGFVKNALQETAAALQQIQPRYVIIMPNQGNLPYSMIHYTQRLTIDGAVIYERGI